MSRNDRLTIAQRKVDELKPGFEKALADWNAANDELAQVRLDFDPGEDVKVVVTCKRGCCVENEFSGKILVKENNGTWQVQGGDGYVYRYVSHFDMKRGAP